MPKYRMEGPPGAGTAFDSGLRMDQGAFDRGTLAPNYHTSPNCGVRETYRKADYKLREAALKKRGGREASH